MDEFNYTSDYVWDVVGMDLHKGYEAFDVKLIVEVLSADGNDQLIGLLEYLFLF